MTICSSFLSVAVFSCLMVAVAVLGQSASFNMCQWIQCSNGGLCQPVENSTIGYRCRCQFGFTGILCDDRVNITTCGSNPCENKGNCTLTANRMVQCTCLRGYTGARCELTV